MSCLHIKNKPQHISTYPALVCPLVVEGKHSIHIKYTATVPGKQKPNRKQSAEWSSPVFIKRAFQRQPRRCAAVRLSPSSSSRVGSEVPAVAAAPGTVGFGERMGGAPLEHPGIVSVTWVITIFNSNWFRQTQHGHGEEAVSIKTIKTGLSLRNREAANKRFKMKRYQACWGVQVPLSFTKYASTDRTDWFLYCLSCIQAGGRSKWLVVQIVSVLLVHPRGA